MTTLKETATVVTAAELWVERSKTSETRTSHLNYGATYLNDKKRRQIEDNMKRIDQLRKERAEQNVLKIKQLLLDNAKAGQAKVCADKGVKPVGKDCPESVYTK